MSQAHGCSAARSLRSARRRLLTCAARTGQFRFTNSRSIRAYPRTDWAKGTVPFVRRHSQNRDSPRRFSSRRLTLSGRKFRGVHGGAWSIPRSSVLIVDRSDESREVLKTALERRGWQIFEAARAADGLGLARQHRPALIVLDLDAVGAKAAQIALAADAAIREIPLVLLGTIRRTGRYAAAIPMDSAARCASQPLDRCFFADTKWPDPVGSGLRADCRQALSLWPADS